MIKPAIILESGRVVKVGDLIRLETTDRGAVVGRFVNAVMDVLATDRFNIRIVNEVNGNREVINHRYIEQILAY